MKKIEKKYLKELHTNFKISESNKRKMEIELIQLEESVHGCYIIIS